MDAATRARVLALAGIEVRATQSSGGGQTTGGKTAHEPAGSPKGGQFTSSPGSGIGYQSILPPASAYNSGGGSRKPAAAAPANTPQAPTTPRTMKPGDSGEDVRYAQYAMSLLGFKVSQDGQYGPETEAAVKQIQERLGVTKPNGHLSSAQLRKLQDAVRLSPCVGAGQRDLSLEAQWEARDVEEFDDVLDEDTEALIAALGEFIGSDERSFNEALHPRNPKGSVGGGRFRSITDRIVAALSEWKHGNGPDDPLKDFNRDQLLKAAKAHGHTFRRGASIEEIKAQILDDVRNGTKAEKAATPHLPGAPADHRRFTIQLGGTVDPAAVREVEVENKIRAVYEKLRPDYRNGRANHWLGLADLREALPDVSRQELDAALIRMGRGGSPATRDSGFHLIPVANSKALKPRDRAAEVLIGGEGQHAISFEDASPLPLPKPAGTATDVGIFAAPSTGRLSLYRESDTGKKQGRAIKSFTDMAALEAWARDNGHTELADYAKAEQARTSGAKAPSEKTLAGDSALKAAAVNPTGDQLAAVTRMGGDGAYVVNDDLRANDGNLDALTPKNRATVEAIDTLMADSKLTQDVVVHRKLAMTRNPFSTSMTGDVDPLNRDLTGFSWVEPGYSSTDVHGENLQHREISLRITVPAGTPAISHKELDNGEVLLPRGSTFKVTADHGGLPRKLDVEVVPKAEQARTGKRAAANPLAGLEGLTTVQKRAALRKRGLSKAEIDALAPLEKAAKAAKAAPAKSAPASPDLDRRIAEAEARVKATRERLAKAQAAFDAASRDPKAEALGEHFPLGTGGSGGGRQGSTDAQLRRYVDARKARDAAQSQHVRAEAQLRELTARRGAVGKYGRETVSAGDAIKVKGLWWRVQRANDKTVQIDAGPGMEVKYRWDQVTDHRPVATSPATRSQDPSEVEDADPGLSEIEAWAEEDPADFDDDPKAARARELALLGVTRALGHDVTPGHDELHHYWTIGAGRHRWVDSPKPWTTLLANLVEEVHDKPLETLKRWASRWFFEVKGYYAGSDLNRVAHGHPPRGHRIGPG